MVRGTVASVVGHDPRAADLCPMAHLGIGRASWCHPGSTAVASCDRQLNLVHPVRGCRARLVRDRRVHLDGWVRPVRWVRSVHPDRWVRLGSRVR